MEYIFFMQIFKIRTERNLSKWKKSPSTERSENNQWFVDYLKRKKSSTSNPDEQNLINAQLEKVQTTRALIILITQVSMIVGILNNKNS